jgi:hypothetical protein
VIFVLVNHESVTGYLLPHSFSRCMVSDDEKENRQNEKGKKEPMNPQDIAEHDPTPVKRDKNQGSSGQPV